MKAISPQAYNALRDALPLIVWRKSAFETYIRGALGEHPELLVGISFDSPKREAADVLMDRLMGDVSRYRETTIALMLDIASMDRFRNIEAIKDARDREKWLQKARDVVAELRRHTVGHSTAESQRVKRETARAVYEATAAKTRRFADDLAEIKAKFLALHALDNAQERGREFERVLNDLFAMYDMEPKLSYSLPIEQIDGAITFDTDDYIIEAKWTKEPIGRDQLDILAAKVGRRGKNALGILISQGGFTSTALAAFRESSPFLAVTGEDLYFVLEGRIRFDDLLRAKKRHANETGDCMLPATALLVA